MAAKAESSQARGRTGERQHSLIEVLLAEAFLDVKQRLGIAAAAATPPAAPSLGTCTCLGTLFNTGRKTSYPCYHQLSSPFQAMTAAKDDTVLGAMHMGAPHHTQPTGSDRPCLLLLQALLNAVCCLCS